MTDVHITVEYLKNYAVGDTFVETGTYYGDAVKVALEHGFKHINTIELNLELYNKARELFKGNPEVKVFLGDSVIQLPLIINSLTEPATFWLDAHASGPLPGGSFGNCPLEYELRAIKMSKITGHSIFIDDRRLFGSSEWGFVSEESILDLLSEINPAYNIYYLDGHQEGDVIVATTRPRVE